MFYEKFSPGKFYPTNIKDVKNNNNYQTDSRFKHPGENLLQRLYSRMIR